MISDVERVIIENVYPEVDNGKYPAKNEINEPFLVSADIFMDGHDSLEANLLYRKQEKTKWNKTPLKFMDNDRFSGSFVLTELGTYEYTIEAYPLANKELVSVYDKVLEVIVERKEARCAAWYEMWPRSQGKAAGQSAVFKDMESRLPDIKKMGFDVVYLTPIHPIGTSFKKGRNNALKAKLSDPGSPYCIGNKQGGHKSVEPSLGTIKDFERFVKKVKELNMEVALDIALNCSFDHPYIKQHPEWFYKNPDGTIKYAENPPKKYQDVYPLNFFTDKNRDELWREIKSIFLFWIKKGVFCFRVDNPHTKPMLFWKWLIGEIRQDYPEVIFLAEAFTRPKVMKSLAKIGFTQSYTYFTWRNYKHELIDYFIELTQSKLKCYMRGNLFTNTPDILPYVLQSGGKPAFKFRLVLAATLSSLYGIYNGFELLENKAISGKEEYLNSEKYEYKVWDWDRPGNIKNFVTKINRIRKENVALHYYDNLNFYFSTNDAVLFYGKYAKKEKNAIFVVVNLDPFRKQNSLIHLPLEELGIGYTEFYEVRDLITNQIFTFRGKENYVELDPQKEPAHILRLERWQPK